MGTNYYWRDSPCGTCKREDVIHVCKSRTNWRAYPHQPDDEFNPRWSPLDRPILSLADWRAVFAERSGTLWDEYGGHIPDPVAWLDEVTPPDRAYAARLRGWHARDLADGTDWFDPAGHFFHDGEFC